MDLLKTTITIMSAEAKIAKNGKTMFKIKGSDNRSYQLWQTKQDGNKTTAFVALEPFENLGVGKAFDISYKEEAGEYEGKSITYRTIVNAFPVKQGTSQKVAQIGIAQSKEAAEDDKWDIINFGKCKFGFLIEAYKLGKSLGVAEKEAEAWANASMRMSYIGTSQIGEEDLEDTIIVDDVSDILI